MMGKLRYSAWRVAIAAVSLLAMIILARPAGSEQMDSGGTPHPDPAEFDNPSCTDCHDDILDGKVVHEAAKDGCDTCHTLSGAGDDTRVSLEAPAEELCVMCHDNPVSSEGAVSTHMPVEEGMCTACHSPHAAQHEHLVLGEDGGVANGICLDCHTGIAEEVHGPVGHGAVEMFGCVSCHLPHASRLKTLLRRSGNDLCLECHAGTAGSRRLDDRGRVLMFGLLPVDETVFDNIPKVVLGRNGAGHPVARHPVQGAHDPLNTRRPFGCDSCHPPHGALRQGLLMGKAQGSFCLQCHRK